LSLCIRQFPSYSSSLSPAQPKYSIIIPAYNEQARIPSTLRRVLDHLCQEQWDAEILVVDDGSSDTTSRIIGQFAAEHLEVRLVSNPGNRGKGFAVRNGMLNAKGEILLFTDADLSSPISEASKLFAAIEEGADVAVGSRWLDPALQTERQPLRRQLFGRMFNFFLRLVLGLKFRDTQCGFKAFTREAAERIFPLQLIHRFGFDPEILYLARKLGLKSLEIPVLWAHDHRSTVNPLKDGLRMGMEVLRVRWYAWTGKYGPIHKKL